MMVDDDEGAGTSSEEAQDVTRGRSNRGHVLPRSNRGRRTREAILAAAVVVFGREGVRQTSMLAIAEEAGIASGTVYQYFSRKEDIFQCLLDQLDEDLQRVTKFSVGEDGRFRAGDAIRSYLHLHRSSVAIQRAWWDMLDPRSEFTDAWLTLHEQIRSGIEEIIRNGQTNGLIDATLDTEIASQVATMLFERSAYSRNIVGWEEELTDDEVSDIIARLLGDGLRLDEASSAS